MSLPGRVSVVCKEPLGPDAQRRLQHEVAILERLRGVAGVAQLVDAPRYPGSIVLVDAGDITLAGPGEPLAIDELIRLAGKLAHAVAGMHRRGVLHRDITPANIVISGDGDPCLVGFALATSFAEIRPEFTPHSEIVGSLAYLAPEQTGRTGRSVDQRADLYALGATLYELATGQPPFGSGDPLRLTHDHLARVPVPPAQLNPAVPAALSEIVMRLLEKEPDHRYQSAEGLAHDLHQLRDAQAHPAAARVRIGEHDVPPRLLPPSRLVGREAEAASLEAAFEAALTGRCQGVLVSGAPGVGKTALVDQLRPVVTGRDGWFVAGKFDQYRRDIEFNAGFQAFRALGRLLLAEPEDALAAIRERIIEALGANAGLLSAVVPEFAALLGVPPDAGDPLTAQARTQQAGVQGLRAVASRNRPVVVFLDDLQWGGRTPLGFVDLVLSEEPVEGLLLVGAYRDVEVDAAHPLTALLSRWREQAGVRWLGLENLAVPSLVTMVAETLHADRDAAARLAEMINERTSGNPYETLELLNALHREGVLAATAAGWRWDDAAARARLGQSEVAGLLAARVAAMPPPTRALVEAMACLGGRAEVSLLQTTTAASAGVVDQQLAPALDEGVLVIEPGLREAVRFRHDRTREVILRGLDPPRRRELQLAVARRLAGEPELYAVAAEQYLPVIDAVDDAAERRQVVGLLRHAADQAVLIGEYTLVNALLVAALRLIGPRETATLIQVRTGRHAALCSLGRLEEADAEYHTIERLCPSTIRRADATAVQVRSLTHRKRFTEAIDLGLKSLRACGITIPAAGQLAADLDHQYEYLYRWLDTDTAEDLVRPEITDPTLLAATRLLDATLPPVSFLADHTRLAWLCLEALRIWLEHGPGRTLVCSACFASYYTVVQRGNSAGYRALGRLLAWGEARGYEPETSYAHYYSAILSCWFQPLENGVHAILRAREGLIAGGDLAYAGYTYHSIEYFLLDCAPALDHLVEQLEAGVAFARRTGNEQIGQVLDGHRWLAGVLRGGSSDAIGTADPTDRYADNPMALLYAHLNRALAAAVFGDPFGLAQHTAAAMPLLPAILGHYSTAVARLLRGLALAGQARTTAGDDRTALLAELDETTRWLAARAADAPDNFLHLQRWLEAERAWVVGDVRAAELAFDAARREVAGRARPWHRALITERAARFYLARGLDRVGGELLAQARQTYAAWGASAKVDQLDWAYPRLRPHSDVTTGLSGDQPAHLAQQTGPVTTGTLDLLGILAASQALSSETSIERLRTRVVEVLSAMTGATGVQLLLWNPEGHDWLLPAPDSASDTAQIPDTAPNAAGQPVVPLSVLRYVQRLREPVLAADATRDDRFARDPYFTDLDRCSLLAVPILSRGSLRAVLVLENRLIGAAFTAERLDAVSLIAGQLAVSLDNAQLYAELTTSRARVVTTADQTRRRIERDLHDGAQQRLVSLALQARAAQASAPLDATELRAQLDSLATEATTALDELRELARGIHPAALADGGLPPALKVLARRSQIPVELEVTIPRRLPEQIEIATYYLVAEALTNTAKHAYATTIGVTVDTTDQETGDVLRVCVRDDGRGGADLTRGTGLVGLKDRAEALGGRLVVHSAPGAGTTLHAELPLSQTHKARGSRA
ncbi:AAA family ATPase [Amycolatopsis sp. FDAARGOS 1241]|uniref:AAA family ATPase n=1 Tax=Amycolatopsis sp. FDAARGOS 1241 TaxID=2778070 RepID=UPI00194FADAB|nr:AAA family ATPase [Amycolatopsis sp. FDAARGOS 1241]QRP42803.1 AAA family ATPase [Amycolatopsis sp. FDAARGOS 1241]